MASRQSNISHNNPKAMAQGAVDALEVFSLLSVWGGTKLRVTSEEDRLGRYARDSDLEAIIPRRSPEQPFHTMNITTDKGRYSVKAYVTLPYDGVNLVLETIGQDSRPIKTLTVATFREAQSELARYNAFVSITDEIGASPKRANTPAPQKTAELG